MADETAIEQIFYVLMNYEYSDSVIKKATLLSQALSIFEGLIQHSEKLPNPTKIIEYDVGFFDYNPKMFKDEQLEKKLHDVKAVYDAEIEAGKTTQSFEEFLQENYPDLYEYYMTIENAKKAHEAILKAVEAGNPEIVLRNITVLSKSEPHVPAREQVLQHLRVWQKKITFMLSDTRLIRFSLFMQGNPMVLSKALVSQEDIDVGAYYLSELEEIKQRFIMLMVAVGYEIPQPKTPTQKVQERMRR